MNTFQRVRLESDSFFQKIRKFDSSPEVQEALKRFNEVRSKMNVALDTKIANYDFEGAINLMHEEFPELETAIERLKDAVAETSAETDNTESISIYNPMEEGDVNV